MKNQILDLLDNRLKEHQAEFKQMEQEALEASSIEIMTKDDEDNLFDKVTAAASSEVRASEVKAIKVLIQNINL